MSKISEIRGHKYVLLYVDDDGVRHIVQIPINMVHPPAEFIGVSRYTDFDHGTTGGIEFNGAYPVIKDKNFGELFGKVMTICDAMSDNAQREAVKSLMKDAMSTWYDKNVGYTFKSTESLMKTNGLVDA